MLLGLHTYSLYLHGIGQAWADFKLPWPRQLATFALFDLAVDLGLDGLHLDDGVLEHLDGSYLREVNAAAREHGLYLEYNFSMDLGGMGIGIQHDLDEAIATAKDLGADIVKVSMDLKRPRPVSASRFHPDVMGQMKSFAARLKAAAPAAEEAGIKIAVENHCDSFSEEILWLLDRVDHSAVGACIDTVNALMVMEDPMQAIENLAPRAFTNHFRDDRIEFQRYGFKLTYRHATGLRHHKEPLQHAPYQHRNRNGYPPRPYAKSPADGKGHRPAQYPLLSGSAWHPKRRI
jgi:sugar phosphate isomerase/epimerase